VCSSDLLAHAMAEMERGGADAVLVNCAPPNDVTRALTDLSTRGSLPFGGFAHVGRFSPPSWKFEFFPQFVDTAEWPAERYAAEARRWRELGATIFGGCCGTGPGHIAALRAWLAADARSAQA
jgi:S-methylmethionine-dependent homocysteine/selenocysteine methylase